MIVENILKTYYLAYRVKEKINKNVAFCNVTTILLKEQKNSVYAINSYDCQHTSVSCSIYWYYVV